MGIFRQFPYSNFHDMNLDWLMKTVKQLAEEWAETHTEWEGYKDYIDNYFANLDLTEETQTIINRMISSGVFLNLLKTASVDTINTWLNANITNPSNPPLDSTFLLESAAARSEAVGWIASANQNILVMQNHTKAETNITAVQNKKDGTVRITGSAPTNISFFIYNSEDNTTPFSFTALAGVTYHISGCPVGGGANSYDLDLRTSLGGAIKYVDYGNGAVFTPTADEILYPHIRIVAGNGNGLVFKPQIEINTMSTPFVPENSKSAKDTIARGFIANVDKIVNTILSNGSTVNQMVKTAMSYINHNADLVYGQETALHWYENGTDYTAERLYTEGRTPTEIDCSTLALLVLMGVPYELSRYAINDNIIGAADYHYDPYNGNDEERAAHAGERTLTYRLAKYLYDNGIGYIVDEDNIGNLKAGDLLFFNADEHDPTAWMGIDHCEVLIDTYTNIPTNYKMPTLITANSAGGRSNAVEINNRNPAFYNGTSSSHRRLVYAASLVDARVPNRNKVVYVDPHKDRAFNVAIDSPAFMPITVEFDGVLNVSGTHFTFYINGTPKEVTMNIPEGSEGEKIHYRITYAPNEVVSNISIIANNTNSVITDVYITSGVAK